MPKQPDTIGVLFNSLNSRNYILLARDEEIELARKIQIALSLTSDLNIAPSLLSNDEHRAVVSEAIEARSRLVSCNLRLVVKIAKGYQGLNLELSDLINEGAIGLMRAAEKYNPMVGTKFSTYAYGWIMQAMTRALALKSRTIRLPQHMVDKSITVKRLHKQFLDTHKRSPRISELAELAGMNQESLSFLLESEWRTGYCTSLNAILKNGEDTELGDLIAAEDSCEEMRLHDEQKEAVALLFDRSGLLPKEQEIITLCFGLDGGKPKSLEAVSHVFGVSRERIRQIKQRALRKLRSKCDRISARERDGILALIA